MDRNKMIPGLDILLELFSLIDNVVDLKDYLMVKIGTVCHVTVFEKVFNFVDNIFN